MILFLLMFTLLAYLTYSLYIGKEIQMCIIRGFMVGFLHDIEEEDRVKYHTVQILLGFLSITILWES